MTIETRVTISSSQEASRPSMLVPTLGRIAKTVLFGYLIASQTPGITFAQKCSSNDLQSHDLIPLNTSNTLNGMYPLEMSSNTAEQLELIAPEEDGFSFLEGDSLSSLLKTQDSLFQRAGSIFRRALSYPLELIWEKTPTSELVISSQKSEKKSKDVKVDNEDLPVNTIQEQFSLSTYCPLVEVNKEKYGDNAFVNAAKHGQCRKMQLIMDHPHFANIQERSIAYAFAMAARNNQLAAMELIIRNSRFNPMFLAGALPFAAAENQLPAMKLIMNHPNFSEISENRKLDLLGTTLSIAEENDYPGVMDLIVSYPTFFENCDHKNDLLLRVANRLAEEGYEDPINLIMNNINSNAHKDDGTNTEWVIVLASFSSAARENQVGVMKKIMNHPTFIQMELPSFIPLKNTKYGLAFTTAAQFNQVDAMKLIMNHPGFAEIDANGLRDAFLHAAKYNRVEAMELIMQHPRFYEIDLICGLVDAFVDAAKDNSVAVMELIMQHPRFYEIDPNGFYGVGNAFLCAAKYNRVEAMELIMQHPRFYEINVTGKYGLEDTFHQTVLAGHVTALKLIMSNPRFAEMQPPSYAFRLSSINGSLGAMKLIMDHERFAEIPANGENGLNNTFEETVSHGQLAALKLIMSNSRFAEIDANCLSSIFFHAALYNRIEIMELIMQHPRFNEINVTGEFGLEASLREAAFLNVIKAVQLIMSNPRFAKMAPPSNAFRGASINGFLEVMKLIMDHERFAEIPIDGKDGLQSIFAETVRNNRHDAVDLIMSNPRCKKFLKWPW